MRHKTLRISVLNMFSVSGTSTPVPNFITVTHHEQLGPNVTWINDWYSIDNVALKGWFKTNINHKNNPSVRPDDRDILDLNEWRFQPQLNQWYLPETEEKPTEDKSFEAAITLLKDEGEISGLG